VCRLGKKEYAKEFGRYLPDGTEIGIVDDDGVEGPSDGDSTFEIGDYLTDGQTIYLDPDYCDTWYGNERIKELVRVPFARVCFVRTLVPWSCCIDHRRYIRTLLHLLIL
jgi:hypothetical protein